jgi:hypothetical protein
MFLSKAEKGKVSSNMQPSSQYNMHFQPLFTKRETGGRLLNTSFSHEELDD